MLHRKWQLTQRHRLKEVRPTGSLRYGNRRHTNVLDRDLQSGPRKNKFAEKSYWSGTLEVRYFGRIAVE